MSGVNISHRMKELPCCQRGYIRYCVHIIKTGHLRVKKPRLFLLSYLIFNKFERLINYSYFSSLKRKLQVNYCRESFDIFVKIVDDVGNVKRYKIAG